MAGHGQPGALLRSADARLHVDGVAGKHQQASQLRAAGRRVDQQAEQSRPTCLHNVAEDLCVGVRVRAKAGLGLWGRAENRRVCVYSNTGGTRHCLKAAPSTGIDGCSAFIQLAAGANSHTACKLAEQEGMPTLTRSSFRTRSAPASRREGTSATALVFRLYSLQHTRQHVARFTPPHMPRRRTKHAHPPKFMFLGL